MLRIYRAVDPFQIFHDFINGNDVAELRFHIEEVPFDDARDAVADRPLRHDGLEAIARGIHDRVADAGAGGVSYLNFAAILEAVFDFSFFIHCGIFYEARPKLIIEVAYFPIYPPQFLNYRL